MIPAHTPPIWLHCQNTDQTSAALSVARHIRKTFCEWQIVLSLPETVGAFASPQGYPDWVRLVPAPEETTAKARAFVEQLSPAAVIWFGGGSGPLQSAIARQSFPGLCVNAHSEGIAARPLIERIRHRRTPLAAFTRIYATDGSVGARLKRNGVPEERIEITGPIYDDAVPEPFDAGKLAALAETIGSRPLWFAPRIVPGELPLIVNAHKAAQRRGHRLLLVASPRSAADGEQFADRLREAGLRVALRSADEVPQEDHQALVADRAEEEAIWYRLAPLAFIGGTMSGPDCQSPFVAACVGAAVLHGPITTPWSHQFSRLKGVGAARLVRSEREFGAALGEMIGPDRAATMAHAGWEEVSRSAQIYDKILAQLDDWLIGGDQA